MTALRDLLIRRIQDSGPLTLAEYMADCLLHPQYGYYATRDPLGAAGDFTTAPEISQMFGELIGLSLAQCWLDQGAPSFFLLVECGPGRGTLMADILRATQQVPGFHQAMQLHLVETSLILRAAQQATLGRDDIHWHDQIGTLPDAPLFLVANEFFDALPVRQFQRDGVAWRERQVGLEDGQLCFGLSGPCSPPQLADRLIDTQDGDIIELNAAAESIAQNIGTRITEHGGAALIIDYGDWHTLGDTFQALQCHKTVNPLDAPGAADLTAHVDFAALAAASAPALYSRVTPQGVFLERLGITERARVLAQNLEGDALETHIAAHQRLTHPQEMGTLFKVISLYPSGFAPPPGLEP